MVAETKFNAKSSRSHTVFRVNIKLEDRNLQTNRSVFKHSEINFVDLAGSEGASKCKSIGLRLREGGNINKSLLALSNVIHKLSQQVGTKQKYYINFRDSKLTRILQNSLLGQSQTAIICCISQLTQNYQESVNSLNFCMKAKSIKTEACMNEVIKE